MGRRPSITVVLADPESEDEDQSGGLSMMSMPPPWANGPVLHGAPWQNHQNILGKANMPPPAGFNTLPTKMPPRKTPPT